MKTRSRFPTFHSQFYIDFVDLYLVVVYRIVWKINAVVDRDYKRKEKIKPCQP